MADYNVLFNLALALFFLTLRQGEAELIDVRLVDGAKPTEGTVIYTEDCETWQTTCGTNLDINDVIVFCRHLGFAGANKALKSSPFMPSTGNYAVPSTFTNCGEGEESLSSCPLSGCPLSNDTPGGAVCHASNYLGCFKNNGSDRVLKGPNNQAFSGLTIDKCIAFCRSHGGMVYAGVEFGHECYCEGAASNYSKYEEGSDSLCQIPCDGSQTENCGGVSYIAIFNISADPNRPPSPMYAPCDMTTQRVTLTSSSNTFQQTSTRHPTKTSDSYDITATATTPVSTDRLTTNSSSRNDIALYAAIGGGVAGVVVICIVIIILVCICRRKGKGERNNDVGLKDVAPGRNAPPSGYENAILDFPKAPGDDTLHRDMVNDQQGKVEKDAFTAQMKRGTMLVEYANMKDRDKPGVLEPEARLHLSYENVQGKPATSKEGDDLNRLPAMSTKRRPEPEGQEHAKDTGNLYAMPENNRKSQVSHSAQVQPPSHVLADNGDLYAMPEKNGKSKASLKAPVQPPSYHFAGDNGDLYAMPEKNRKSKVSHGAPVQERPNEIDAMYAMPNKPRSPQEEDWDETVMVENELYG